MTFRGDFIESLELPEAQSLENCVLECLSVLEHVFPLQTKHDTYVLIFRYLDSQCLMELW